MIFRCNGFRIGYSWFIVSFLLKTSFIHAQTIDAAEYFFDTDPGTGNGIAIPIPVPGDYVTLSFSVSTAGLSGGRHYFFMRTHTSDGKWALFEPREFFVEEALVKAEYFFDDDPGAGNGTSLVIPSLGAPFSFSIDTKGLTGGRHHFFARMQTADGKWSLLEPREFFVETSLIKAEYFFDTDPGIGNGMPLPVGRDGSLSFSAQLPVDGLTEGDHYLFVRVKDETSTWSMVEPTLFTVSTPLPIELIRFSAEREGAAVDLSWLTVSESNNDYFVVERWIGQDSYTDESFRAIGRVEGNGTTLIPQQYRFKDFPPDAETIYYRLKQVDYDGKSSYSRVAGVSFNSLEAGIKLYPNPGSNWFTLEGTGKDMRVEIFTSSGSKIESYENVTQPLVFGNSWIPGVYVVKIRKQEEIMVMKVVKIDP